MKSIFAPVIALAVLATPFTSAMAASPPQAQSVKFNDLDLESADGKKTLDARIRNAARRVCDDHELTGTRLARNACVEDVHRQVIAQVKSYQNRVGKGG